MAFFSVRDSKASMKRVVFWNAMGSVANAGASFAFLAIITNLLGKEAGGQWSICFSIAQLMWTVGLFEATTYFATDAADRFSPGEYLAFKFLSCGAMVVVSIIYVATFGFGAEQTWLALTLCLMKLIDAFGGFWYALFQKNERLDISGFSVTMQMVITLAVFAMGILVTREMLVAAVLATAAEAAWVFIYNPLRQRTVAPVGGPEFVWGDMGRLFLQLLPLFIATFLSNYLTNIPRYAIQSAGDDAMQGVFNVIFMPSFVINLLVLFMLRPTLTPLSDYWVSGQYKRFFSVCAKLIAASLGVTAVVLVVAAFLGIPVLQAVFGVDLSGNLGAFLVVLLGGGLLATANIMYNGIIILRRQKYLLIAYIAAVAIGVVCQDGFVRQWGIMGASALFLLMIAVLFASYLLMFFLFATREISRRRIASDGIDPLENPAGADPAAALADGDPVDPADLPNPGEKPAGEKSGATDGPGEPRGR